MISKYAEGNSPYCFYSKKELCEKLISVGKIERATEFKSVKCSQAALVQIALGNVHFKCGKKNIKSIGNFYEYMVYETSLYNNPSSTGLRYARIGSLREPVIHREVSSYLSEKLVNYFSMAPSRLVSTYTSGLVCNIHYPFLGASTDGFFFSKK